jgi:DNA polymerase-3 subunit beta
MKLTIEQSALLPVLQATTSIVSTRTALPILGDLLLEAKAGKLSISATDLDTGIRLQVDAEVEKEGCTTIPARKFLSIVRELASGPVSIAVDAKKVTSIVSGTSQFKINGRPEEDFPPLHAITDGESFTIGQAVLAEMINLTSFAMSDDVSRLSLNGILFTLEDGVLTLVATDGRRLSTINRDLPETKKIKRSMIVPTKGVMELVRNLGKDGDVTVTDGESSISFTLPKGVISTKKIEGNYPNWKQVMPSEAKVSPVMPREDFLVAVRRVALLASEKSNSIKLIFSKGTLTIRANTPEVGEAEQTMELPEYKNADIEISFNPEFLMAPLRAMPQETVALDLTDGSSPALLHAVSEGDEVASRVRCVLMPMRS